MTKGTKALYALAVSVVTGVAFVVNAAVLHGTALVAASAVLAALDAGLTSVGVFVVNNPPKNVAPPA